MPLRITGRHMTITESHRDYLDKKVNRLRRLCPTIDELDVTLTREKLNVAAEANFRAGRITALAVVTAAQVHEAIDALIDKLEAQVARTKARRTDKKSAGRDKNGHWPEEATEEALDNEEAIEA